MFVVPDDPRITRLGKVLRRWRIDELRSSSTSSREACRSSVTARSSSTRISTSNGGRGGVLTSSPESRGCGRYWRERHPIRRDDEARLPLRHELVASRGSAADPSDVACAHACTSRVLDRPVVRPTACRAVGIRGSFRREAAASLAHELWCERQTRSHMLAGRVVLGCLAVFWCLVLLVGAANPGYSQTRDYVSTLAARVPTSGGWVCSAICAAAVAMLGTALLLRPLSGVAALLAGTAGSGSSWSPSRGSTVPTVPPGAASGAASMSPASERSRTRRQRRSRPCS